METSIDSMDETSTDITPRLTSPPPISATSSPISTGHRLERLMHSVEQLGDIHNFTPKKIMESINNSSSNNNNDTTSMSLGEVMNLMPFASRALLCNRNKAKVSPESSSSPPSPLLFWEANRIGQLRDKFTKSGNGLDKATARPREAVMGGGGGGDRDKDARRFIRHLRSKRRILREMARSSVLVDEPKTEAEAAAKKKATDEYHRAKSLYLKMLLSRLFKDTPYSVPRPPDATRVSSGVRSVSRRPVAAMKEVERERGGRGGPMRRGRRPLDVNNVLDDLRDLTL